MCNCFISKNCSVSKPQSFPSRSCSPAAVVRLVPQVDIADPLELGMDLTLRSQSDPYRPFAKLSKSTCTLSPLDSIVLKTARSSDSAISLRSVPKASIYNRFDPGQTAIAL